MQELYTFLKFTVFLDHLVCLLVYCTVRKVITKIKKDELLPRPKIQCIAYLTVSHAYCHVLLCELMYT